MSNPFDDLEADNNSGSGDTSTTDSQPATESNPEPADQTPTPTEPRETIDQSQKSTPPSEAGPAFEYSDVKQKPLYARADTWNNFEKKLKTSIGPFLAENDIVDEETRELHDAVLRLAVEEPERVGELVLEARRE